MLAQMVLEYTFGGRVERAVEIDTLLFVAADAPVIADIATRSRDTDNKLDRLEQRITAVVYAGAAAQLADVHLRKFPFDKIKIDQSFIRDLVTDAGSRAIVRAVIALGDSLGMTTTAEGVETEEQLAELRREGCTDVLGYLFSKPISASEARLLLTSQVGIAMPAA